MTADQLRTVLRQMEWTQRELAEKLDISERHVRRYVGGRSEIPTVVKYAVKWLSDLERR